MEGWRAVVSVTGRAGVVLIDGDLTDYTFPYYWNNSLRGCPLCGPLPEEKFIRKEGSAWGECSQCQNKFGYNLLSWQDVVKYTFEIIKQNPNIVFVNRLDNPRKLSRTGTTHFGEKIPPNLFLGVNSTDGDFWDVHRLGEINKIRRVGFFEPLTDGVNLLSMSAFDPVQNRRVSYNGATGEFWNGETKTVYGKIDWVICGGEVGTKEKRAKPLSMSLLSKLRDDCRANGVPFFFRGWGDWIGARGSFTEEVNEVFCGKRPPLLPYDRYDWPNGWQSFHIGDEVTSNAFEGEHPEDYPKLGELDG